MHATASRFPGWCYSLMAIWLAGLLVGCAQGGIGHNNSPAAVSAPRAATASPRLTWHDATHPSPDRLPAGESTGTLAVTIRSSLQAFSVQALPASATAVDIVITGTQLDGAFKISVTTEQFNQGIASFSVASLFPGQYTVSVAAVDAAGTVLASGKASLTIVGGSVVSLNLVLGPPSTASQVLQTIQLASGSKPESVVIDTTGKLWVVANGSGLVLKVDPAASPPAVTTAATASPNPVGIALDAGDNKWVTYGDTTGNSNVVKVKADGTTQTLTGSWFNRPTGIAAAPDGSVWVANNGAFTSGAGGDSTSVVHVSADGLTNLQTATVLAGPWGVAVSPAGIADTATTYGISRVYPGSAATHYPYGSYAPVAKHLRGGIAIDRDGNLWTTNDATHNVTKVVPNGIVMDRITHFPIGDPTTSEPLSLAVDPFHVLWVTDRAGDAVVRMDLKGTVLGTEALPPGTRPWGVAIDALGNAWVAGYGSDTLLKLGKPGQGGLSIRIDTPVAAGTSITTSYPTGTVAATVDQIPVTTANVVVTVKNANNYVMGSTTTPITSQTSITSNTTVAIGSGYTVLAEAKNFLGIVLAQGSTTDVAVTENQTTSISITLSLI